MALPASLLSPHEWLLTREAAALLGISERYVYYLTYAQHVRVFRLPAEPGGRLYLNREDLLDYQQRHPRLGRRRRTP